MKIVNAKNILQIAGHSTNVCDAKFLKTIEYYLCGYYKHFFLMLNKSSVVKNLKYTALRHK